MVQTPRGGGCWGGAGESIDREEHYMYVSIYNLQCNKVYVMYMYATYKVVAVVVLDVYMTFFLFILLYN